MPTSSILCICVLLRLTWCCCLCLPYPSTTHLLSQHARDELGIDMDDLANPLQASLASAVAFTVGAAIPLLAGAFILDTQTRNLAVLAASTLGLLVLGATGAALGGARQLVGALRVLLGGLLAMAVTYGIGYAFAQLSDGGHL